ncbi:hypothetical protein [Brasilonema bromeliae]|uniref:Uncharacterized protein n=1 Tax=Brasilonema bromeliae SPC951 TaxID=385972 RepID=A0ABX1P992_9CYAN|nr:hypothetical protein [Brasilonema bromeliae]NMG20588.1 hypothetical protein [Brasilonema bromeliae SPC951]
MNVIIRLLSVFSLSVSALAASTNVARALETPTTPQQTTTQQNLCSSDTVENLLPTAVGKQSPSPLSYLAEAGFTQKPDGSWVCYVRDNTKQKRYYTLLKVQQVNGALVASSFLENGTLTEGQDARSLELFMSLISNYTNTNQGDRQGIQRYLESFISLVKQGKVPASGRGYLFDLTSRGFVVYQPITQGQLQGTAITINITSPQNLDSSPVSQAKSLRGTV